MNSDNIDSITDTVESLQVASTIKDTYFNMINTLGIIPENKQLIQLWPLADLTRPTNLIIPDNVININIFRYNCSYQNLIEYGELQYTTPEEFLRRTYTHASNASDVIEVFDVNAPVPLLIQNNKMPNFWTSFDDKNIICDSYDASIESTLQENKTACWAQLEPQWSQTDLFVPSLDSHLFPILLADAKSLCFVNLKEIENPAVDKIARKQWVFVQNKKSKTGFKNQSADYGRHRRPLPILDRGV